MKLLQTLLYTLFFSVLLTFQAAAQSTTTVVVRALAKDAKFIGDGMGGAMITIIADATGDTLARGLTKGGTGDTERLVKDPVERYETLSTPKSAKFEAALSLEKPTLVTIKATAPYGEPHARITTSTQHWLIPGKDITGDGIILEVPGFTLKNKLPKREATYSVNEDVTVRTHIVMMCGCPTSDGGLWDSSEYEIKALIKRDGKKVDEVPLSFTGETNWFETSFTPEKPGRYNILVYAFHPQTANAGVTKTQIMVQK